MRRFLAIAVVILCAFSSHAAWMFGTFTNAYGEPDTNSFLLYPLENTVARADGTFRTGGLPRRMYPSASGFWETNLMVGNWLATNSTLGAFAFRAPEDSSTNRHSIYTNRISGLNTFVTIQWGTNPPTTSNEIASALGGVPALLSQILYTSNSLFSFSTSASNHLYILIQQGGGGSGVTTVLTNGLAINVTSNSVGGVPTFTPNANTDILATRSFAGTNQPLIWVLGDSMSDFGGIPGAQGWVQQLIEDFPSFGNSVSFVNSALYGDSASATVANWESRYGGFLTNSALGSREKWLIAWLGYNDGGGAANTIKTNLLTIYNLAHSNGFKVAAITTIYTNGHANATTLSNVNHFITNNTVGNELVIDAMALGPTFVDGVHPTAAFCTTLAEYISTNLPITKVIQPGSAFVGAVSIHPEPNKARTQLRVVGAVQATETIGFWDVPLNRISEYFTTSTNYAGQLHERGLGVYTYGILRMWFPQFPSSAKPIEFFYPVRFNDDVAITGDLNVSGTLTAGGISITGTGHDPLRTGMSLWMPLDEGAGLLSYDYTGTSVVATNTGLATNYWVKGKFGNGVGAWHDGTTASFHRLNTPWSTILGSNAWTVSWWAASSNDWSAANLPAFVSQYSSGTNGTIQLVTYPDSTTFSVTVVCASNSVPTAGILNATIPDWSDSTPTTTNWHWFAVSYDGTNIIAWFDGVARGIKAQSGPILPTGAVSYFANQTYANVGFLFDDLRAYSRAMTTNEVALLFLDGRQGDALANLNASALSYGTVPLAQLDNIGTNDLNQTQLNDFVVARAGGAQTPWTGPVDADWNDLTNANTITASNVTVLGDATVETLIPDVIQLPFASALMMTDATSNAAPVTLGTGFDLSGANLTLSGITSNQIDETTWQMMTNDVSGGGAGQVGATTNEVVILPRNYGAIAGDGLDDTIGLQAAIDAVLVPTNVASSGTVLLDKGGYTITNKLIIRQKFLNQTNRSMIVIRGAEPIVEVLGTAVTGPLPTGMAFIKTTSTNQPIFDIEPNVTEPPYYPSYVYLTLENLSLRTPTSYHSTNVNMLAGSGLIMRNCAVSFDGTVGAIGTPPIDGSAGIVLPPINRGTMIRLENLQVWGYGYGIVASEHTQADEVAIMACRYGIYNIAGNYPNIWNHTHLYACNRLLYWAADNSSVFYGTSFETTSADWKTNIFMVDGASSGLGHGTIYWRAYNDSDHTTDHNLSKNNTQRINTIEDGWNGEEVRTDVTSTDLGARTKKFAYIANSAAVGGVSSVKRRGTQGLPTTVAIGDAAPYFSSFYTGSGADISPVRFGGIVERTVSAGHAPSGFGVWTGNNDTTNAQVFRITADGRVGIGTTNPAPSMLTITNSASTNFNDILLSLNTSGTNDPFRVRSGLGLIGQLNTNGMFTLAGGTAYPSNTWSEFAITNVMSNFSIWHGSSNGQALISLYLSNGVSHIKQHFP